MEIIAYYTNEEINIPVIGRPMVLPDMACSYDRVTMGSAFITTYKPDGVSYVSTVTGKMKNFENPKLVDIILANHRIYKGYVPPFQRQCFQYIDDSILDDWVVS